MPRSWFVPCFRDGYVPSYVDEESFVETGHKSVVVFPLVANKRPVGFAPWPESYKKKKTKKPDKKMK